MSDKFSMKFYLTPPRVVLSSSPRIKPAIEARLGKTLALSSVYRMLARHGWRKLAPDTHHPQGDPEARDDWKKNSPALWTRS